MAAREYYNSSPRDQYEPRHQLNTPLPPTPTSPSRNSGYGLHVGTSPTFNGYDYPSYPSHAQSQQSLGDDSLYYGSGARQDEPGAYADNIPLKSNSAKDRITSSPIALEGQPPYIGDGGIGGGRGRRRSRPNGFFARPVPWFVYVLTTVQIGVFIGEIIKNAILTGSPIEIHPSFNPMIGPSPYVYINMGARYVACMRNTPGVQDSSIPIVWPCPNTTTTNTSSPSMQCSLSDLCGFSGVPNPHVGGSINETPAPNQWFRFILPMFLHAGIVHIGFNMLLQMTMGCEMERLIGTLRFGVIYFASGIFGFILGGNFAASGIASTGASGCLFGILALTLLDLLYTWKQRPSPVRDLLFILLDVVISFVLGLLPGLDNFAHIGGFLMGLVLGICLLRSPSQLRPQPVVTLADSSYAPVHGARLSVDEGEGGLKGFIKQPVGFFRGRKPLWWAWWVLRAVALVGGILAFILLLNNFYKYRDQCSWCKYLSCLPIKDWCDIGNLLSNTTTTTNSSSKRDLFGLDMAQEAVMMNLF